jgi:hypothetical protein
VLRASHFGTQLYTCAEGEKPRLAPFDLSFREFLGPLLLAFVYNLGSIVAFCEMKRKVAYV